MKSRAFRPIAVLLSVLLLASTPVHAGPVAIGEVLQILGSYQNPPQLRLRSYSQTSSSAVAGVYGSAPAPSGYVSSEGMVEIVDTSVAPASSPDSLLSGITVDIDDPQRAVEIIAQGDVQGTICDCGEVMVAAGGFPKWPLLFLAAIPFFFIHGDEEFVTPNPISTPTPLPTPTPQVPIPEPASLLLFGSGLAALGAGLRRRYAKAKLSAQVETAEEG